MTENSAARGLVISGITKAFDTQSVLLGIDLTVRDGCFCSILGPSGSGKTTLLRIIAGFEHADAGQVALDGKVLDDGATRVAPEHRGIGYVPQEGSLFPHLDIESNVGFGLPRAERRGTRVRELIEMVGLAGYGRRYPHELSGGQQQRVALARALAVRPALVLLDEPFSSLDASLRATVRRDVRRVLTDAGTTAVLVTHDQDEALSLSDAVAIIHNGKIGQVDTPEALYAHPSSAALAAGVGEANFLTGSASGDLVETALGRLTLEAPATGRSDVVVLIRPEQLCLDPSDGGGIEATVIDREYYGHDAIARVRGNFAPASVLTVRIADVQTLPEPGTTVRVAVHGPVVSFAAPTEPEPEPAEVGS
jgi:iron(III) transport system ATP-binding protein